MLDNPEHPVKISRAGLAMLAPLVKNLTTPVLPAVRDAAE